jgi:DNA-binding SARP family transcriptional activator/tetratricopeptide (TPR) repeat protein
VQCRVLGPLEFRTGSEWTGVSAPKWRALFAALLAEPGRVVSMNSLVDELWPDYPPSGARKLVSGYVARLRGLIGDPAGRMLVTQAPGYRLMVTRDELDYCQFEDQLVAGRDSLESGDPGRASDVLARALGLWRGSALADVPRGPSAAAEADRLEELRLAGLELRIEASICCGHAVGLVPELRRLIAGNPLRERFWHQLMRVLADSGRRAEALAIYTRACEILAEELGTDPGPDLKELHRRVLAGELASTSQATVGGPSRAVVHSPAIVPRQLPAAPQPFIGRGQDLAHLSAFLGAASGAAGAVLVLAIEGTAGVGKTALAVQWAHQVAAHFPDGQLYANLRGYDTDQPVPATDALAGFLHALGVLRHDIPAEPGERAAHYRSLLADRRVLVVLDNAREVEQVRPLLPGAAGCVAVVTSRDSLAGLVARDGAARHRLDLLGSQDSIQLLGALIGARVDAAPLAAAALATQCARLPLALRVAAELATARPTTTLAQLVAELADQKLRLRLLDAGGDPRTAVQAVFSWSYKHLGAGTAQAFRRLGLHPGPDLDGYAAAALTGSTCADACRVLDQLARAHLIQSAGQGRYGMHDLLRAYAAGLAAQEDEDERQAALTRLLDHYLHTAAIAMDTLFPAERHRRPSISPPATPVPAVSDPATARVWLDTEQPSLIAAAVQAADNGQPRYTTRFSATLFRYLYTNGRYPEAISLHTCARKAAYEIGDRAGETEALIQLGCIERLQGRYEQAIGHLQEALILTRETGDLSARARALGSLGLVEWNQGLYDTAAGHYRKALALHRENGDRTGEIRTLGNLGVIDAMQGRFQQAIDHLQQVLVLSRQCGDQIGEAHALDNLGDAYLDLGCLPEAASHLEQALALHRAAGDRSSEANVLTSMGSVCFRQGHHRAAADNYRKAWELADTIGERACQARALNGLGQVAQDAGDSVRAHTHHADALAIAAQISEKREQARAHEGLASSFWASGDLGQASSHWGQALQVYDNLGAPEADRVRSHLAMARQQR